MATPNMGMTLPTENASADVWDTLLNAALGVVDAHDHTPGKGVLIPAAALKINADVPWSFGGTPYAITGIKALDFAPVAAATVGALAGAFFVNSADNELYYRTTGGVNVKFTTGATLNVAGFAGGIGGDYSAIGALLDYDDATDTYRLRQETSAAVRQYAKLLAADLRIAEYKAAGNPAVPASFVTLKSPGALAASYALTFAAALPASQVLMQVDATGAIVFSNTLANNQSITLQGAGDYKHGDTTIAIPFVYPDLVVGAGTASNNGAALGVTVNPSSTVYIPLRGFKEGKRIKSLSVRLDSNSGGNVTYQLYIGTCNAGTPAFSPINNAIVSNSGTVVVVTIAGSGIPLGNGDAPFLGITTAGGVTVVACLAVVTYDHN